VAARYLPSPMSGTRGHEIYPLPQAGEDKEQCASAASSNEGEGKGLSPVVMPGLVPGIHCADAPHAENSANLSLLPLSPCGEGDDPGLDPGEAGEGYRAMSRMTTMSNRPLIRPPLRGARLLPRGEKGRAS
jgi:hypothetical protein